MKTIDIEMKMYKDENKYEEITLNTEEMIEKIKQENNVELHIHFPYICKSIRDRIDEVSRECGYISEIKVSIELDMNGREYKNYKAILTKQSN